MVFLFVARSGAAFEKNAIWPPHSFAAARRPPLAARRPLGRRLRKQRARTYWEAPTGVFSGRAARRPPPARAPPPTKKPFAATTHWEIRSHFGSSVWLAGKVYLVIPAPH